MAFLPDRQIPIDAWVSPLMLQTYFVAMLCSLATNDQQHQLV
jgi:hypothetical protein